MVHQITRLHIVGVVVGSYLGVPGDMLIVLSSEVAFLGKIVESIRLLPIAAPTYIVNIAFWKR